jgi:hypothetical protein
MLLIPISIFVALVIYHFVFLRIFNFINDISLRFDSLKKKRIFQSIVLASILVSLIMVYGYFEKSANQGVGGQGFGNIVVQCLWKSFQSQENYRRTGANDTASLSDIIGSHSGFFSGDYPTDKAAQHDYIPYYDSFFQPYRSRNVNLLEIGVKKGGSLKMWREYFSQDSHIFGLDIDPAAPHFPMDTNMKTIISSSYDEIVKQIFEDSFFDIIIDDGSHWLSHQYFSFVILFPKLKHDGIYVIEDIQNSNDFTRIWSQWNDIVVKLLPDRSGEFIAFITRKN